MIIQIKCGKIILAKIQVQQRKLELTTYPPLNQISVPCFFYKIFKTLTRSFYEFCVILRSKPAETFFKKVISFRNTTKFEKFFHILSNFICLCNREFCNFRSFLQKAQKFIAKVSDRQTGKKLKSIFENFSST